MKKAAGLLCMLAGVFCVAVEFWWTTAETRDNLGLPGWAAVAVVFTMGVTGLVLLYAGYRLIRGR